MRLYHLSENGNIIEFLPKRSKEMWGFKNYVWAINEEKIHNYFLPRECPRICLSKKEALILDDWIDKKEIEKNIAYIFIPEEWKVKINNCTLFKYQFNPNNFYEIDSIAGYYVSNEIEIPIGLEKINNCLRLLNSLNIGVKFLNVQRIRKLRNLLIQSAKEFSIIKWGNIEDEI